MLKMSWGSENCKSENERIENRKWEMMKSSHFDVRERKRSVTDYNMVGRPADFRSLISFCLLPAWHSHKTYTCWWISLPISLLCVHDFSLLRYITPPSSFRWLAFNLIRDSQFLRAREGTSRRHPWVDISFLSFCFSVDCVVMLMIEGETS